MKYGDLVGLQPLNIGTRYRHRLSPDSDLL